MRDERDLLFRIYVAIAVICIILCVVYFAIIIVAAVRGTLPNGL